MKGEEKKEDTFAILYELVEAFQWDPLRCIFLFLGNTFESNYPKRGLSYHIRTIRDLLSLTSLSVRSIFY